MEGQVHTRCVWLKEDQLGAVKKLFEEKGWELQLETDEQYRHRKETADAYVTLKQHERIPSPGDKKSPIQLRRKSQTHNEMASQQSITLDKSDEDLKRMKEQGASFKKSMKSQPKVPNEKSTHKQQQNNWRLSKITPQANTEDSVDTDVIFTHYVLPNENTIKILTKLSTMHVQTVSHVPVRIVLLVDKSGSMLHKLGRDSRYTKITKVKHFVDTLIQSLDDGDEVALVTFGDDADVLFPLVKLDNRSRDTLRGTIRSLDRGSMSRLTNLSAGLRKALRVFYDATKDKTDYLLSTKNSILVLSDCDINDGTTNTNDLIHEVRQNIRQMAPSLEDTQNQWVTISVVNTGTSISEQAYALAKTCSNDAYYYIDNAAEDPEAELFLPVLLRKTAVAWNISYVIEALNGIQFVDGKCSSDNRIRLRRSLTGNRKQTEEKSYFLYDFPAGYTREFGVYASWKGPQQIEDLGCETVLFKMRVEFTNIKGERYWQEVTITKGEIIEALEKTTDLVEASNAAFKHEMKLVSGDFLRTAAQHLKTGNTQQSKAVIQEGQRDLQALLNAFGDKSEKESQQTRRLHVVHDYAKSVVSNMTLLIDTIDSASNGAAWNKVKAVSTAISRETPNTTETLVDGDVVCPFPTISCMETGALKGPLERMQAKNKANKRITFGNLDNLLETELM